MVWWGFTLFILSVIGWVALHRLARINHTNVIISESNLEYKLLSEHLMELPQVETIKHIKNASRGLNRKDLDIINSRKSDYLTTVTTEIVSTETISSTELNNKQPVKTTLINTSPEI
eukprot:UN26391